VDPNKRCAHCYRPIPLPPLPLPSTSSGATAAAAAAISAGGTTAGSSGSSSGNKNSGSSSVSKATMGTGLGKSALAIGTGHTDTLLTSTPLVSGQIWGNPSLGPAQSVIITFGNKAAYHKTCYYIVIAPASKEQNDQLQLQQQQLQISNRKAPTQST
jgi:hypothetical protein